MAQHFRVCWQSSFLRRTKVLQGDWGSAKRFSKTIRPLLIHRTIHGRSLQVHFQKINERTFSSSSIGNVPNASDRVQLDNRRIIAKLLGINENEVTGIPKKMIDEEKAVHTLEVLREFGFTSSSVHLYPELFLMSGGAVENYIRIMQETGFPSIREVFIVRFRTVCKQSLSVLERKISLPNARNIVEIYCKELEEGEEFFKQFLSKLPQEIGKMTLFDLRNEMLSAYLTKILSVSQGEKNHAFGKYPRLYYRCFNWIKRNYKILKDFGFPNEKIKCHFYLLHTNPNNLNRVLKIKSLAGMDMKKLGLLRPKILMSSHDALLDIEQSLIKHKIPFDAVLKYPEVFTLSADTIRQRLQEIDSIPEFKPLKTHPRIARLLYYQNKAKSRLEDFRTMQVRMPSLHLLSTDKKRFDRTLAMGDFRVRGVDVTIYLSEVLQTERQRIHEGLVRHPHWLQIPLVNIKSVLKFIQSVGCFRTDQLVDAITILLYPKERVEREFENVQRLGEAVIGDDFFLQMVLYNLERPSHFSGDAVWPEKVIDQEYEDEEGMVQKFRSE